jgi:hypothetical protein
MTSTLAVGADESLAFPSGRDGFSNTNEKLIHGRARKWPIVVLNVLADRIKKAGAVDLTAHAALSEEPNFRLRKKAVLKRI